MNSPTYIFFETCCQAVFSGTEEQHHLFNVANQLAFDHTDHTDKYTEFEW